MGWNGREEREEKGREGEREKREVRREKRGGGGEKGHTLMSVIQQSGRYSFIASSSTRSLTGR